MNGGSVSSQNEPRNDDAYLALAEDEAAQQFLEKIDGQITGQFTPQEKGTVLQLGCSTDVLTTGLLERSTGAARIVVVDPRLPILDSVRFKTARKHQGKVFFSSKFDWGRLPFDDEVFVAVVSNLFWSDAPDRERFLVDIYRVMHHAGTLLLSTYMQGSFREILDLYGETLTKFDLLHVVPSLHAAEAAQLTEQGAVTMLEDHGFSMCRARTMEIPLEFAGSKALLGSPLVRALWLPALLAIGGEDAERILWHLREAVDRYFATRPMPFTVKVGILSAIK